MCFGICATIWSLFSITKEFVCLSPCLFVLSIDRILYNNYYKYIQRSVLRPASDEIRYGQ